MGLGSIRAVVSCVHPPLHPGEIGLRNDHRILPESVFDERPDALQRHVGAQVKQFAASIEVPAVHTNERHHLAVCVCVHCTIATRVGSMTSSSTTRHNRLEEEAARELELRHGHIPTQLEAISSAILGTSRCRMTDMEFGG